MRVSVLKYTRIKIIKNEVECRDATMLKTVDTRNQDLGIGLRKIVACSQPYTCGAFLHVSTV